MPIESISIRRFRNLKPAELSFSPQLNLFFGENAAGKTSLLEALFVLARARSFRTTRLDKLIQYGEDSFELVVRKSGRNGRILPVGIRRVHGRFECRIDGRPAKRLSELAILFPAHWLGGNLHALVEDGPAYRRQFLDWGLFHVKQDYMSLSRRFGKLLKQRNAALRSGASRREIEAWNRDLAEAGESIDRHRRGYLEHLQTALSRICAGFPAITHPPVLGYRKGWSGDAGYEGALANGFEKDHQGGFTHSGPHRGELAVGIDGKPASDCLSRGQQKLLITALHLAQATVLHEQTGHCSLFLLDDLGSELDARNQDRVLELLLGIRAQVFVTAIEEPILPARVSGEVRRFHVEHGSVSEVV